MVLMNKNRESTNLSPQVQFTEAKCPHLAIVLKKGKKKPRGNAEHMENAKG